MTRLFYWLCLPFCLALVLNTAFARAQEILCLKSGEYGSLLDAGEFGNAVQALPPEALSFSGASTSLPKKVILDNLPAIAQQGTNAKPGSPGSCEAQSFGYGLGSYTAARTSRGARKWDPSLPQNSVSAAYLYALIHQQEGRSCPTGSRALGYLAQLTAYGSPTRARIAYLPECSYLNGIPSSSPDFPDDYPGMRRFRIGSYAAFSIGGNPAAIDLIKAFLRSGQPVAFSGQVLCNYAAGSVFEKGVIYQTAIEPDSGHGQLVVGYDETVGKPGQQGALLVQNSFGTHWPPLAAGSIAPPGMAYWSYNSFAKTQLLAAVAYPREEALGPGRLKASSPSAPPAAITRAYQWAPPSGKGAHLILTHVFKDPIMLQSVSLTEPGGEVTAAAVYGQYISSGYSYLKRADGSAFLSGLYAVALKGVDLDKNQVSYTGKVWIGGSRPLVLAGKSMKGVAVTGSTGAQVTFSLSGP